VTATVCLTFDVDAEAGLDVGDASLTSLSERRYGITRGLPRILAALAEAGIHATFYVPGATAERHPDAIREVLAAGHEIGHHGHRHLAPHRIDAAAQRRELERGLAVLEDVLGVRPRGYRSPSWELTRTTLGLLVEHGFAYDSSCMGDDRPYRERHGDQEILELPVHWSLDDVAYYEIGEATLGVTPAAWHAVWLSELRQAVEERRVVTYTMHPEVIGRAYRLDALRRLIDEMAAIDGVRFARHADVSHGIA
jgi:peptidoglycan/xylan/chitin deacetylase (PgdA/CDA1 family)